jgi:UDP-N-acetylglucosamine--N-acetylmuramyl-(pentapeptide) pyrophosphoryl-undecaprenol N-acetylglucosamine transferase
MLGRFRPDVVFSTGGFVSVPTVVAAALRRIPILTHEQTAYVGLATKINARFADVIALSFERSRQFIDPHDARVVITGNPVRSSVLLGDPRRARDKFGLRCGLPLVYVTGGAQGARAINAAVGQALPALLPHIELVHQCGPRDTHPDIELLQQLRDALPEELRRRYAVAERIGTELGDLFAATSLVVGRAGAGTVAELAAAGLPSILIPLPGAEEQRQNALYLVEAGAAIMIPQDQITADWLAAQVLALVRDRSRLDGMAAAARASAPDAPAMRLAEQLLELASSRARQRPSA